MKRTVMAVALLFALLPSHALAQPCGAVVIEPDPGWPGADILISGTGFTPGTQVFVNFGGSQVATTTSNAEGAFAVGYTIPADFPVGPTNVFVQDAPANCEANPSYTVNASPPTTTTTAAPTTTTTTAPSTTTTQAATTTTSEAVTTTTTSTSDSTVADTTTTSVASDDSGSSSGILLVLLGAVVGAGLLAFGMMLGRRDR